MKAQESVLWVSGCSPGTHTDASLMGWNLGRVANRTRLGLGRVWVRSGDEITPSECHIAAHVSHVPFPATWPTPELTFNCGGQFH